MLQGLLAADGRKVGRLHVRALMKRMGIEAIYRRPNTSKREPGHKIFPYLLRKLPVTRPNQVWAMDLTYIPCAGFCLSRRRHRLVQPGIVRVTATRQHLTMNNERLCGTELTPLSEGGGTVQLEIFAAVEMALPIEMIVYG